MQFPQVYSAGSLNRAIEANTQRPTSVLQAVQSVGLYTLGMAKDESFDISTGVDANEVANAIDQARREINPKASKCRKCKDADFVLGGLCAEHEQELQALKERLAANSESLVLESDPSEE